MADEASSGQSARDRRRERAKATTPGAARRVWKQYQVHLVIVLVFGAIVTGMAVKAQRPAECPGHWHSALDVYTNGERVSFAHPKFTLEGSASSGGSMTPAAHMHRSDDFMMHMEGRCVRFDEFVGYLDLHLSSDKLVLDGAHKDLGQAGTFTADGNHTLRALHKLETGSWTPISISSLNHRQVLPNERVLVLYGNDTADAVAGFESASEAHTIQSSSSRSSSAVPAVGVAILGCIILIGWHVITRKS